MTTSRDHAFNTDYNELRDQDEAIGGPPSRSGMAWAVVNALTTAGFDLAGDDFRDLERCEIHGIRRCTICPLVKANLEDFRS
jgi:hypothetical protein